MGYTSQEGMVRVDFFREGGKWYTTEHLDMAGFFFGDRLKWGPEGKTTYNLPNACIEALHADPRFRMEDGRMRYSGMWAVVLKPYHEFKHPQMFRVPERWDR